MENSQPVQPSSSPTPEPITVKNNQMIPLFVGLALLLAGIAAGVGYFVGASGQKVSQTTDIEVTQPQPTQAIPEGVVCTMDAKICPDGSSVGRQGPNCEFAECPRSTSGVGEVQLNQNYKKYGNSYFEVTYPSGYRMYEEESGEVILVAHGPSQQDNPEGRVWDGVYMSFKQEQVAGTVEEFADAQISTVKADGANTLLEDKKKVTVGNYSGFSYVTEGIDVRKYYVIQSNTNENKLLHIRVTVPETTDPTLKKQAQEVLNSVVVF